MPEAQEELDFRSTMEALFVDALGPELTPTLRTRLKEAGLDLDRIAPAYPRKIFARCCRIAVEELFPQTPSEEALRILGRKMMMGYTRGVLGRAAFAVFKLIGVRRGLDRLTRAFRNGDNYTETKFEMRGDGVADVWINQVNGQPSFTRGALEVSLDWVGAKDATVEILRLEGDGAVYRLTWRDA